MGANGLDEYWVPEHVKDYLRKLGFVLPLDDMEPWIRSWDDWMSARGVFYDYRDKDGMGRVYAVHRRSIHPAMRVCKEWGSLLLNEEVKVVCEDQKATDWIGSFSSSTNFMAQAQATVVRAFGLGTGAWALWVDLDRKKVRIRHYDARMVIPLTWDEDGVTECAFVTRAFYRGKAVDQLQMHLKGGVGFSADLYQSSPSTSSHGISNGLLTMNDEETYKIVTVCFDHEGNELAPVGILPVYDTGCAFPTFSIVKPAVTNTRVDMSPYGQSVFADAVDAVQAVDLTGFGIGHFDFDESHGYVRTATEVSSDNSALMRNIRRHENALQDPIVAIARAAMAVSRGFGEEIPDEGVMSVMFDDSIIQDVAAEKAQDMAEVGVTMNAWEYRAKWYGEDEKTAKALARGLGKGKAPKGGDA